MRFAPLLVISILSILPQAVLAAAREDSGAAKCGPAPIATPIPATIVEHGETRVDDYPWLRNLQDPKVRAYLTAENSYAQCHLTALNPLINEIQSELRSRVGQEETEPPFLDAGYLYQSRYDQGANYPTIVRWIPNVHSEELVLDVPALAASHQYYSLDKWLVSPDGRQVAFAVDLTGGRRHHLFLRNIASGKVTEVGIEDAGPNLAFSADGQTLFYVRLDPINLRAYQVWRHKQGGPDVLVYSERDPRAEVSVYQSTSRKFILIKSEREDSTEVSYIPADRPNDHPSVIAKRRDGVRYFADHVNGRFFVRTNLEAPDYRLMVASETDPSQWTEIIPNESGKYIREFRAFDDFVAIEQEHDASLSVRVFRLSDLQEIPIPLSTDVAAMSLEPDGNREPESHRVRIRFSRLNQKERSYDFDMASRTLSTLPEGEKSDWLIPDRYSVERIIAWAADGEQVPVTLVYRKDLRQPHGNPTLLYGYGAYGDSVIPDFDPTIFSLIDRGFIYAIAHVRGGRERGERWYSEGRQLKKRNSFTDFISAAETLIKAGYAAPHALFAQGASAGGLLVAAAANMRPTLFAGIVAEVPFVDVITTASDPSVPLSTLEYREWGNPRVKDEYDYMLSYSPYENISRKAYPSMLVTGALYDTQVTVREPAKWLARLRARKADGRELLFKVSMKAGHQGPSGRLGSMQDVAEIQAWLLAQAGLAAYSARASTDQ